MNCFNFRIECLYLISLQTKNNCAVKNKISYRSQEAKLCHKLVCTLKAIKMISQCRGHLKLITLILFNFFTLNILLILVNCDNFLNLKYYTKLEFL